MRRAAVLAACAAAAAGGRPRRRRAQATDDDGGFTCVACASEESLTAWYVTISNTEYTCDPATYPIYVNKDGVPTTAHVFKHPACSYEYGTRAGATGGAASWVTQWCADDGTIWEASDCACEAAGGGACDTGWDDDGGYDDDDAPCDYDPGACVDDRTTTDAFGDDCAWYACNQGECGAYDDGDFAARDQCCACGGGTLAPSSYDDATKKPSASDDGGDGCALHVAGPVVASQGNQVATVDSLQNYELAFTMELASDWSITAPHDSIIFIGDADQDRLPGIWFDKSQNALYVMQTYQACAPKYCQWGVVPTDVTFAAGETYDVRVVVESDPPAAVVTETCGRPSSGCVASADLYTHVDCDGDGILDHLCARTDDGVNEPKRWLVLSSEGCPDDWGTPARAASECANAQMTVYVDGALVGTASGSATYTATDAAVYVGDPWWDTAIVTLSDITLSDIALADVCRESIAGTTTTGSFTFQAGRCYPQSEAPVINTAGLMSSTLRRTGTPQECYDYCTDNSGFNIMGLDLRPTGGQDCQCNHPSVKSRKRGETKSRFARRQSSRGRLQRRGGL